MEKKREKISREIIRGNNRLKIVVLDTNILIDNVHGFATWVDHLLNKQEEYQLVVPTIVVAEYLTAHETETASGQLRSKKYLALFKKIDLTFEIAEVLGQILRRKTYTISANTADLIIAATAIYLDAELATRNKIDFSKIPNLRLFEPKNLN